MIPVEIGEAIDLYTRFARNELATDEARKTIGALSEILAKALHQHLLATGATMDKTLCVFILRGGALLLPGFLNHLAAVPFCLLSLKRDECTGEPSVLYSSDRPDGHFTNIVYVDCVAASGKTVDVARREMGRTYQPSRELLAVISSSDDATRRLSASGVEIVGVSLYEKIEGTMLAPDLGRFDAGDILSGKRELKRSDGARFHDGL